MKKFKYYGNVKQISSIRELNEMAARESTDTIAYKYKGADGEIKSVTFGEFYDITENLGAALTKRGYGDAHMACIAENRFEWIVAYFTVLKSAGVYVPIDKELPAEDKCYLLNDSDSKVVFYSKKYEQFIEENRDKLPGVELFIGFDLEEDADEKIVSYSKLVEEGKGLEREEYDSLKSDQHDMKMLVYTSGTTGIAKGVMLTEHNLVSSVYYGLRCSQIYDTGLSVLPYNHTYESVCDILVAHHFRTTLCICSGLKEIVKELKLYRPKYIYLVPAIVEYMYANIIKTMKKDGKYEKFQKGVKISRKMRKIGIDMRKTLFGELQNVFGGNLVKIVCGGAPIRPEIGQFFGDIGIILTGGYGITECSPLVSVNDEKANDYTTAGRRLECLEWRIDDATEDGIGEIAVKGDVVMKGYYKSPEKTAEVLSEDGWFSTGDYGYITDDDQIVITGRKKNIIVLSNGKNIYPEEIENYVMKVEYIEEAVVRSRKDDKGQEIGLTAEVYIPEEIEKTESEALHDIQSYQNELPGYKRVQAVTIRREPFAKTTTNKIKR
ncbi:MAG: AMP-binding protein [Clostridia bacterium]|nr:AMP-binding protein [Clostridia bacterium]